MITMNISIKNESSALAFQPTFELFVSESAQQVISRRRRRGITIIKSADLLN